MNERRKYIRIPEKAEISYRLLKDKKIKAFLTQDISRGGIRFLVHDFVPKGSLIEIRLSLSKIYFSFETLVKVAWVSKQPFNERYEVGVEFVSIPQDIVSRLVAYVYGIEDDRETESPAS